MQGLPRTLTLRGTIPRLAPTCRNGSAHPETCHSLPRPRRSNCGHYCSPVNESNLHWHPCRRITPTVWCRNFRTPCRLVPDVPMTNNSVPHEPCGPRVSSLSLVTFQSVHCGHFVIGPVDLPVYPSCSSATQEQASPQEPWSHCAGYPPVYTNTDHGPPSLPPRPRRRRVLKLPP